MTRTLPAFEAGLAETKTFSRENLCLGLTTGPLKQRSPKEPGGGGFPRNVTLGEGEPPLSEEEEVSQEGVLQLCVPTDARGVLPSAHPQTLTLNLSLPSGA